MQFLKNLLWNYFMPFKEWLLAYFRVSPFLDCNKVFMSTICSAIGTLSTIIMAMYNPCLGRHHIHCKPLPSTTADHHSSPSGSQMFLLHQISKVRLNTSFFPFHCHCGLNFNFCCVRGTSVGKSELDVFWSGGCQLSLISLIVKFIPLWIFWLKSEGWC